MTRLPVFGLPDRIRRARLDAGYRTHQQLADVIGRSSAVISKWERGVSDPKFLDVVALARATGRPLDFFGEGIATPDPNGPDGGSDKGGSSTELTRRPGMSRMALAA